jgi:sugar-specific transcriptional regulator TrmB
MQSIRNNIIKDTERLLPELQKVPTSNQSNSIWPLLNSDQVESRALEIINKATTSILVSLWPDELDWCGRSLMDAEGRGVNIALVHFGEPTRKIGATYHHPVKETLYTEKGGRGLTLVVDGAQVVIANFQVVGTVDGAWSRNTSFVPVAEDYVKHDVYITKVTRFLGPEVVARFGENYTRLPDVFNSEA